MNDTFDFVNRHTQERESVPAEFIGQLALHYSTDPRRVPLTHYYLSHIASGRYLCEFAAWVPASEIRRLAEMLAEEDFDAFQRGGFRDDEFVRRCKLIYNEWDYGIPVDIAKGRSTKIETS